MALKAFLALLLIFLSPPAFAAQIKIAWDPPTTNADGSPLTDLGGYKVYYGTASRLVSGGLYANSIDVGNVTSYTLDGLTEGQSYFVSVTAYYTLVPPNESGYSNEVVGAIFTVATSPAGLQVLVDSVAYTAPQTFGWAVDLSHLVSVASPQAEAQGTRYVYSSWSDGGSQEHTITGYSFLNEPSDEATLTVMSMPTEDLVGYWAFDEGAGSAANDSSSYGNDASVIGGVWAEGKVRGALAFDGNAHVQIPNSPSLGLSTNQMTFAAWVYLTDVSPMWVVIAQRGLSAFDWQIYARAMDAPMTWHPVFRVDLNHDGIIDPDEQVQGDAVLQPNRWYFITCTYDGAGMNFYIDGTLRNTTPNVGGAIPNGGRNIWVGGHEPRQDIFKGTIDEVRIYNRALSQNEIQALMTPGPAQYMLTANVVGNGSVLKNPDPTQYSLNDSVQLTAVPATGWLFNGWSGDLIGIKNPKNFTMSGNRTVTATFVQQPPAPSITIQPTNQTAIEAQAATFNIVASGFAPSFYQWQQWSDGAWADIPGATTASYTISETALADNGARFRCLVATPANTTYTANFTTQYSLTTAVEPAVAGTVSPSGASWYDSGQSVSVSAGTNAGYSFSNWTGDLSGSTNPESVTMNGPRSVTANFSQDQYSLTVSVSPSGVGSVSKSPDKANYVYGEQVQFTAVASPGYTFSGWSGGASGLTNPVTITMDGNKAVTANFSQDQYSLTVSGSPSGVGSVSKSPDKANYVYGEQVQLTAVASPGYTFSGWSGAASGTANPVTITMDGSKAVTASFTQNQYTLGISIGPSGVGSVSKSPDKATYVYGDQVQLTATANPGYTFSGWGGDASGTANPTTITVNGNKTVTANFMYSLQVSLKAGYNLISFPTIAGDIAITEILSSISGQYTMVYAYEGCDPAGDPWKIYDPALPPYANDLQYVDSAMGIWIEATQDAELTVQGLFPTSLSVPLCAGWNMIAYAGEQAKPVAEALSSIAGKYEKVYSYKAEDITDPWKIYDVSVPSYVNDLVNMEPGLGYWIYIIENCTLAINN